MKQLILASILISLSSSNLFGSTFVVSGHPKYPPYSWEHKGKLYGIGVELSRIIFKELNLKANVKATGPWKRVHYLAKSSSVDLIVALYSNDARRKYLNFTTHYMNDRTSIIVKRGREFKFKSKEDLVGKIGVSILGDSFGQELDQYIKEKLKIDWTSNPAEAFTSILNNRADYFMWGHFPCMMYAKKEEVKKQVVALPIPITSQRMFLAISKQSKLSKHIPAINKIIKRLIKSGKMKELAKKYTRLYSSQQVKQ